MSPLPGTLALDFDGVLCDGLQEQFLVSWQAYGQLWPTSQPEPEAGLAPLFYQLRPVITVGWEMPMLLRAIMKGFTPQDIFSNWSVLCDRLLQDEDLNARDLGQLVDHLRDRWLARDEQGWLGQHRFYPGVIQTLGRWLGEGQAQDGFKTVIVTTKETRFVVALLRHAGVEFPPELIFGKDRQQPKTVILQQLQQVEATPLWFVEDRLGALKKVAALPTLENIELFLASWGYNTVGDRQDASQDKRIHLLDLEQFTQGSQGSYWATWLG
ncbi:HAD family hydrolase [Candidatus Synechococcus calcipolaris G9]|uniref:HAD family hydrolase n=1 Tax=Candidatus Synechococcus calcipolaris G9 TaxID=1497997 RepID=A0ABT6F0H6_9SYNE|nr:HAD family hydrolase [Candidatus Synechococcus calcipolaris]MDG2991325.1 HAD family hydrolase [Candidatus Synechococcus calcipolaris G9]